MCVVVLFAILIVFLSICLSNWLHSFWHWKSSLTPDYWQHIFFSFLAKTLARSDWCISLNGWVIFVDAPSGVNTKRNRHLTKFNGKLQKWLKCVHKTSWKHISEQVNVTRHMGSHSNLPPDMGECALPLTHTQFIYPHENKVDLGHWLYT